MVTTVDVIRFLSNNMGKIMKEGLVISDVIEDKMAHPHYSARNIFSLYYDEKKKELMSVLSCSGSPSCWNHYEMPVISYRDLAEEIIERIEEAKDYENDERNFVEYIQIEVEAS
jgi:hypothetical protein